MRPIVFDLEVLRSFVSGVELGSFAKAALRLNRSTSAVSAHLARLEEQVGAPILRKAGRGLLPTAVGETLLAYARRLLELNDEAATAVRGVELAGSIRLGMAEDFSERVLTDVLGRFARAHPRVQIDARVARNASLREQMAAGTLELALAWDDPAHPAPHAHAVRQCPLHWIGAADGLALASPSAAEPLPLVMFDAPCIMRSAATAALDRAGIAWRIAFTSQSLSGVWAAVAAGLGVTVRSDIGLPPRLRLLGRDALESGLLPPLPVMGLNLYRAEPTLNPTSERLWDIILQALEVPAAMRGGAEMQMGRHLAVAAHR
ncbi:LysR family transcriptional regulator [Oxalobacteraceae bacterium]|nr:LysR family transcriptional regulator [Oxalobacteraceae bacterium]